MQVPIGCSKAPKPLSERVAAAAWLLLRGYHHPESAAAAPPQPAEWGPHGSQASAPTQQLPTWWVRSPSADTCPQTMGDTAALPLRLWQRGGGGDFLQKEYVKLLQILDATAIKPPRS